MPPKGEVLVVARGILVETLPFLGSPKGFYLVGSLVGMLFRRVNRKVVDSSGSEECGLILASVVERRPIAVIREEAFSWSTPTLVRSFFFFLYLQEIGAHKDEFSFEQFHLLYKKLMFEQQKSVRWFLSRWSNDVFVSLCFKVQHVPRKTRDVSFLVTEMESGDDGGIPCSPARLANVFKGDIVLRGKCGELVRIPPWWEYEWLYLWLEFTLNLLK